MGRILSRGNFSKDFEHFESIAVSAVPVEVSFSKSSKFMVFSLLGGPDFSISLDGGTKYWQVDALTKSFGGDIAARSVWLKATAAGTVQGLIALADK